MNSPIQYAPSGQVAPVAPTLSSPTATSTSSTTASLSVTTDQASGILDWILSTSSAPPSVAQMMAGLDSTGAAAAASSSQVVNAPGVQAAAASGLTGSTRYYPFFMQANARFLASNVAGAASFVAGGSAPALKFNVASNSQYAPALAL